MSFWPSEDIYTELLHLFWEMEMSTVYIDLNACVKILFFKVMV